MASIGSINISSATNFTESKTFTGTAASDDWVDLNLTLAPTFSELYLNDQGNLTYNIYIPTLAKSGTYIFTRTPASNAVEQIQRTGSTVDTYNGTNYLVGPGDYSAVSSDVGYTFYGTTGNDTIKAPTTSTKASSLQGWTGDDLLIGGNTENSYSPGPGTNQAFGGSGADVYRSKASYSANDTIVDLGTDSATDSLQVLLTSSVGADWGFERIGNDLRGYVIDKDVGTYNFRVSNQYGGDNLGIEAFTIYSMNSTAAWRGANFKKNVTTSTNYADAGTASGDRFLPDSIGLGTEKRFYYSWGNGGNDTLQRSASTSMFNLFDGGDGTDTVIYAQPRADYTLTRYGSAAAHSDTGYSVRNSKAPTTVSADSMQRVERFKFSDTSLAFDVDAAAGQSYRIYKAAFNRDPMQGDTGGLGYWIGQMDRGMSLVEMSARFIDSNEFRGLYGSNPSNADFLTKVYQNVLGRNPEAEGYNWWLNEMNTNAEKTKAKVLADFSESAENKAGVLTLIGSGITYQEWAG